MKYENVVCSDGCIRQEPVSVLPAPLPGGIQDPPIVVLAEDDDGHAILIQNGLRKAGFSNPVLRFCNGQEALDFLYGPGGEKLPSKVLLLDIRMPGIDGIEVLRQIRANQGFRMMPVIMITTTDDPREAQLCHSLGCSHYVVKSANRMLFNTRLGELRAFLLPGPTLSL